MPYHFYIMAVMYILAGIMHFIYPKAYLRIMPRYLPSPGALVTLSGLAEIILGVGLLFDATRTWSIYLIVAMLTVFLLVHFYMLKNKKTQAGFPFWALILRIPVQFILIWWALFYLD